MRYQQILGTELRPSVLCLGTADMGSKIDLDTTYRMLDAFVDAGGNFLDTAQVYADWLPGERSLSEKTLGGWLTKRGKRDQIVLATKGAHPRLESMQTPRMSRAEIEQDLNASLKNLRTDVIDLYWLHRDAPAVPVGEILGILNDQVKAGKIRAFGCSNWQTARLQAAQDYTKSNNLHGFAANQPLWNIGIPDMKAVGDPTLAAMDAAMWQFHQQTQLAAVPFTSQANGFFNKLAAGQPERVRANTRRIYHLPENQQRLQRIQALSQQSGLSVSQIVLGYLTSQPFPTFPIIGCQNLDQLADSLTAADVQLTADQLRFLEQG